MPQVIGIPKEVFPGEKRVAIAPEVAQKLIGLGFAVQVEKGAGDAADIYDDALTAAGAKIVDTAADIWSTSDIVFKVRAPTDAEVEVDQMSAAVSTILAPAAVRASS